MYLVNNVLENQIWAVPLLHDQIVYQKYWVATVALMFEPWRPIFVMSSGTGTSALHTKYIVQLTGGVLCLIGGTTGYQN